MTKIGLSQINGVAVAAFALCIVLGALLAVAEQVRDALSNRSEKTLYIKADARAPYAGLIRILDAVRTTGVQGLTLLTTQADSENPGSLVPAKGLQMLIVSSR